MPVACRGYEYNKLIVELTLKTVRYLRAILE